MGADKKPTVVVIGLGYIGLPTSLMMAVNGINVIGMDKNAELVKTLNSGVTTFKEKGLDELFSKALKSGIKFTTILPKNDLYIVSVPTPYDEYSKKVDASYVVSGVKEAIAACENKATIVVESTISPGTIDKYVRPLAIGTGKDISFVHCPERIIPGNMVYELIHNNRTIGSDTKEAGELVKKFYSSFCQGQITLTDIRTAEMSKVVENTFRDINIAFANELVKISEKAGLDVYEIIRIANMHPRVHILNPGPGVGGHCISIDPWFLVGDFPEEAKLIHMARSINSEMPLFVLKKIISIARSKKIPTSRIGLYGITYKANVDDTRESPTLQLLHFQSECSDESFICFDPWVKRKVVPNQVFDFAEFLNSVDMVVIMQPHQHIIDNQKSLIGKVVFDTTHSITDLCDNLFGF